MRRTLVGLAASLAVLGVTSGPVSAQSGHFIEKGAGAPKCTDNGTTVTCTGKVAGLGGTTFEVTIQAQGVAAVECENPGGNVAPGQHTAVTVPGTTGPLPTPQNGQYIFTITTDEPAPLPPTPTCPNKQWIPHIVDVTFSSATLSLFEDGLLSDQITVSVS